MLKFPHHGGAWDDKNVIQLLDDVNPRFVVISVGTSNTYDHPSDAVFDEIGRRNEIRLICTEATEKCLLNVIDKRQDVLTLIEKVDLIGAQMSKQTKGCPCAGTVIVELSDPARIIQPTIYLHQELVIKPNFTEHQCALSI